MNLPTWSTEQAPGIQNCTQRPCLKNNNKNKQIFFSQKKKQAKDKNTKTKKKGPGENLESVLCWPTASFCAWGLPWSVANVSTS